MNLIKTLGAALLCLATTTAFAQNATYTFEGPAFETVSGTYSTGQSLTGTLTLSEWVPPNTTMDVTPILVGYSFTDGTVTLNETNSESVGPSGISVTTGPFGRILSYGMTFWESPLPTSSGEIFTGMDLTFDPGAGEPGCASSPTCRAAFVQINSGDVECSSVSGGVCDLGLPNPAGGDWGQTFRFATQTGFDPDFIEPSWFGNAPPRTVPALSASSLLLLMLMLGGFGLVALRIRTS